MSSRLRLVPFAVLAVGLSACVSSDPWPTFSLPSGGGSGSTLGQAKPMRVAGLVDGPADAYMMAVAYRGATEVGRWSGPIDWFRETPASFTLERKRRRWKWSRKDVRSLRVKAPNREKGGAYVSRWAIDLEANRVSIVVVDNPGEPVDGAGTEGVGVRGQGRGHGRTKTAHTARVRGPDTQGEDTADIGQGEPAAGMGEFGDGEGQGNGQGAGQGRGSSDIGTRTGSEYGSESPSWYDNPLSDIAEDGGRTPADYGKAGGSAAGQRGANGHVGGSGWLNMIDVPVQLSGAAALVAIVLAGDIAGVANGVFQKAVRGLARKGIRDEIRTDVVDTAQRVAQNKQRQAAARSELRDKADQMSASQLKYALANVDQSLELATYAAMQKHARLEAQRYRTILAQNKGSARTRELATENLTAWRHIEDLAGEQARRMQKAARPPDSVAKQPYDAHKQRAALEADNPGKVDSTTVPKPSHPNVKRRGTHAKRSKIPIDSRGFPVFDHVALHDVRVPRSSWYGRSRKAPQRAATRDLRKAIDEGRVSAKQFNKKQLDSIRSGSERIPGYTWHHHQDVGRMQLIPRKYHRKSQHVGGYELWQRTK